MPHEFSRAEFHDRVERARQRELSRDGDQLFALLIGMVKFIGVNATTLTDDERLALSNELLDSNDQITRGKLIEQRRISFVGCSIDKRGRC
jgi:hypothetical protein